MGRRPQHCSGRQLAPSTARIENWLRKHPQSRDFWPPLWALPKLHLPFQKRHSLAICKYWEITSFCILQGVNLLSPLPAELGEAARLLPNPLGALQIGCSSYLKSTTRTHWLLGNSACKFHPRNFSGLLESVLRGEKSFSWSARHLLSSVSSTYI